MRYNIYNQFYHKNSFCCFLIYLQGYNLEYIKDLKVTSNINEHATLNLTGVLKTEQGDMDVFDANDNKTIEVYYDENNSTTLFYGIVTNIEVSVDSKVRRIGLVR